MSVANLQLAMMVEELCDELAARGIRFYRHHAEEWTIVVEAPERQVFFNVHEGTVGCACDTCMAHGQPLAPAFYAKYMQKNEGALAKKLAGIAEQNFG